MRQVAPSLAFMARPLRRRRTVGNTMLPETSRIGSRGTLTVKNDAAILDLSNSAEVYCRHCHLATPRWRKRCIHCSQHWLDI
jgi:hypothetical protein